MSSIYAFKSHRIEARIREIQKKLQQKGSDIEEEEMMGLLSEQVLLERVKKAISEKLGRIVLR